MSEHNRALPHWIPYLDLACAFAAAGLCYASPGWRSLLPAFIPWVVRVAWTGQLPRRTPFDLPLALFLLTAGVGIWAAFDRPAAWARFWLTCGAVLLFYGLANAGAAGDLAEKQARHTRSGDLRVWFLALFGAGAAVLFVLTNDWSDSGKIGVLSRLGRALQAPFPRLPGPEANANIVGAILAMVLPFAGLAALQAWRDLRARRPATARAVLALGLGWASLALVAFGLAMTASRGAWVAVAGALLLAALWSVAGRLSRGRAAVQGRIFAAWLGVALLAALAVAAARPTLVPALLDALPGPSAVGARTELWRNGLILVSDYPFTGLGLDGFMMAYSSYVMLLHVGYAPHTHNLYLDVAIEQGLPGLLLLLALAALFFHVFWQEQLRSDAAEHSRPLAAAALSLVTILLHGLVDDPLYKSRAVLFLFVPLALAACLPRAQARQRAGPAPNPPRSSGARRRTAAACGAVALVLILAGLRRAPLLSRVASNLGTVRQSRIELADYTWPEWPIQDEERRQKDMRPAVAQLERALALDAGNASANRRLGQIELSLGQYEAALGHLRAAYAAEPWNTATRQLLGEAYLANGEPELGRLLWSGVSNEQGQLVFREWWYEHIGEKERAQWMRWAAENREVTND